MNIHKLCDDPESFFTLRDLPLSEMEKFPQRQPHSTAEEVEKRLNAVYPALNEKIDAVAPGLGFVYAATLGGYLGEMQAGQRAASHIAPLLVLKNDQPLIAMGAAGGSRIISALVAVTSRIIDQGRPLFEAVAQPRVHATEAGTELERTGTGGWSARDSSYLAGLGYSVTVKDRPGMFGRANIAMLDTMSGEWIGVSDPDWEGTAGVPYR